MCVQILLTQFFDLTWKMKSAVRGSNICSSWFHLLALKSLQLFLSLFTSLPLVILVLLCWRGRRDVCHWTLFAVLGTPYELASWEACQVDWRNMCFRNHDENCSVRFINLIYYMHGNCCSTDDQALVNDAHYEVTSCPSRLIAWQTKMKQLENCSSVTELFRGS